MRCVFVFVILSNTGSDQLNVVIRFPLHFAQCAVRCAVHLYPCPDQGESSPIDSCYMQMGSSTLAPQARTRASSAASIASSSPRSPQRMARSLSLPSSYTFLVMDYASCGDLFTLILHRQVYLG